MSEKVAQIIALQEQTALGQPNAPCPPPSRPHHRPDFVPIILRVSLNTERLNAPRSPRVVAPASAKVVLGRNRSLAHTRSSHRTCVPIVVVIVLRVNIRRQRRRPCRRASTTTTSSSSGPSWHPGSRSTRRYERRAPSFPLSAWLYMSCLLVGLLSCVLFSCVICDFAGARCNRRGRNEAEAATADHQRRLYVSCCAVAVVVAFF
jgi:hypothetical protein